jgi:hypothetical protein
MAMSKISDGEISGAAWTGVVIAAIAQNAESAAILVMTHLLPSHIEEP